MMHLRRKTLPISEAPCPHLAKTHGKVLNHCPCSEKPRFSPDLATLPDRTSGTQKTFVVSATANLLPSAFILSICGLKTPQPKSLRTFAIFATLR
jgi:hypothetical protein